MNPSHFYFCRIVRRDETDPTGLGTIESEIDVNRRTKVHWDTVLADVDTLEIWLGVQNSDVEDIVLLWKRQ